jgi:hypothetical protein
MKGMKLCCMMACLAASTVGQAQGASGQIKVRRPAGTTYFVQIETPPELAALPPSQAPEYSMSDGMVRVVLPCSDCHKASGLIWLELNVSAKGEVEEARVVKTPSVLLNARAKAFAETQLHFKPTAIQGVNRPVRFVYPLVFVVE